MTKPENCRTVWVNPHVYGPDKGELKESILIRGADG